MKEGFSVKYKFYTIPDEFYGSLLKPINREKIQRKVLTQVRRSQLILTEFKSEFEAVLTRLLSEDKDLEDSQKHWFIKIANSLPSTTLSELLNYALTHNLYKLAVLIFTNNPLLLIQAMAIRPISPEQMDVLYDLCPAEMTDVMLPELKKQATRNRDVKEIQLRPLDPRVVTAPEHNPAAESAYPEFQRMFVDSCCYIPLAPAEIERGLDLVSRLYIKSNPDIKEDSKMISVTQFADIRRIMLLIAAYLFDFEDPASTSAYPPVSDCIRIQTICYLMNYLALPPDCQRKLIGSFLLHFQLQAPPARPLVFRIFILSPAELSNHLAIGRSLSFMQGCMLASVQSYLLPTALGQFQILFSEMVSSPFFRELQDIFKTVFLERGELVHRVILTFRSLLSDYLTNDANPSLLLRLINAALAISTNILERGINYSQMAQQALAEQSLATTGATINPHHYCAMIWALQAKWDNNNLISNLLFRNAWQVMGDYYRRESTSTASLPRLTEEYIAVLDDLYRQEYKTSAPTIVRIALAFNTIESATNLLELHFDNFTSLLIRRLLIALKPQTMDTFKLKLADLKESHTYTVKRASQNKLIIQFDELKPSPDTQKKLKAIVEAMRALMVANEIPPQGFELKSNTNSLTIAVVKSDDLPLIFSLLKEASNSFSSASQVALFRHSETPSASLPEEFTVKCAIQ
jgi:hypothetical protein